MKTVRVLAFLCLSLSGPLLSLPQETLQDSRLLVRRYRAGEKIAYHMKAVNDGRSYEIDATGVVKQNAAGRFIEEYAWSNLVRNSAPVTLPPASLQFRQVVSLEPDEIPAIPNLTGVQPALIGPITDLLTFYADAWLAIRESRLIKAGDRFSQAGGGPASWADGTNVILGEDAIDFEITLQSIDRVNGVAAVLIKHVPPREPGINLPAPWMRERVADTANNWVNVTRNQGRYIAAAGKETFDVELKIRLVDGVILSGVLDNPVRAKERECTDAALTQCGDARLRDILRHIEIFLVP